METSSEIHRLNQAAEPVLAVLHASGVIDLERRLAESVMLANNGAREQRIAALGLVQGLCHPKALGDTLVSDIGDTEWLNMLSKLRSTAAEASLALTTRTPSA